MDSTILLLSSLISLGVLYLIVLFIIILSICADELIRMITINCPVRGHLILRVRDEIRMTIAAYQTLYETSVNFGMRKLIEAEEGKALMEKKVCVCVYVCVHICVYVFLLVFVCPYVWDYGCVYTCVSVFVCVCMCVSMGLCMCVNVHVCLCMFVCVCVCKFVCLSLWNVPLSIYIFTKTKNSHIRLLEIIVQKNVLYINSKRWYFFLPRWEKEES